ncbi:TldD/PmbA family protein [Erysipelotrichaceae bacterium AF15-26LB]|nr:TldD/PmbA family protein [[Clostridium] innocuum]RJV82732.1 TldD/PmbA family protein [Erysipelotrichaceae bacterium AF19-24AC]RJV82747.1 TldD/PmbA family protein [Erysipelotrichaceae bacterium AF15-26LB]
MLEKNILETVLEIACSTSGDFAEIFEETNYSTRISMLNDDVESTNSGIRYGLGLRIYHGLESVYGYTNDTEEENLKQFAGKLAASLGEQKKTASKVQLQEVFYENAHPIRCIPKDTPLKEKVTLMKRASEAARAYDEHVKKAIVNYQDDEQHVAISNSEGKYIRDVRIRTRMAVSAVAEDGALRETGSCSPGGSEGMEFYETHKPEEIGKEAARIAMTMLYAEPCPSGVMPVIIDNGFGGVIFHEACGHSLEARGVAKNQSNFAGKLGQKIASECVTAVDDGTIPNAWGSANIDDEGNFTRRTVLIEKGILKSYLVDTLNGRRLHMPSTASSRRQSYQYETTSRMTNTFLLNGTDQLEDMIKETPYGLYAKTMAGGSVQPTGDFNFAVREAYLIEDGKITHPVKGATLIGNGSDTLLKIDRVAGNLKRAQGMCGSTSGSIPTDVGQPAIRVSEMTVGGSEGGKGHA